MKSFRKLPPGSMIRCVVTCALSLVVGWGSLARPTAAQAEERSDDGPNRLVIVVMDPLAAPLACPCVEGYAQRRYEVLAEYLKKTCQRSAVDVVFAEILSKALEDLDGRPIDLIIGKDSEVRAQAKEAQLKLAAVARLTDQTGSTTQHGLLVVPRDDPAQSAADLQGYHVIFGPAQSEEKHAAAVALLTAAGVKLPDQLPFELGCSDAATKVLERGPQGKAAAVISSYAKPLLEGCGTVKKGDLRVVAQTAPAPFITAFATGSLAAKDRALVQKALTESALDLELCQALESLLGFVEPAAADQAADDADPAAKKN